MGNPLITQGLEEKRHSLSRQLSQRLLISNRRQSRGSNDVDGHSRSRDDITGDVIDANGVTNHQSGSGTDVGAATANEQPRVRVTSSAKDQKSKRIRKHLRGKMKLNL